MDATARHGKLTPLTLEPHCKRCGHQNDVIRRTIMMVMLMAGTLMCVRISMVMVRVGAIRMMMTRMLFRRDEGMRRRRIGRGGRRMRRRVGRRRR